MQLALLLQVSTELGFLKDTLCTKSPCLHTTVLTRVVPATRTYAGRALSAQVVLLEHHTDVSCTHPAAHGVGWAPQHSEVRLMRLIWGHEGKWGQQ
eukprot:scaffold109140_cov20-Tisochrysis_lutea.AAC.2